MLSYCVDDRDVITSLCPHDMTGNDGWHLAPEGFGLTIDDDVFDSMGAPLYRLENGKAVERPEADRKADWPVDLNQGADFSMDDVVETLADHEFRVCLLELGIEEGELL